VLATDRPPDSLRVGAVDDDSADTGPLEELRSQQIHGDVDASLQLAFADQLDEFPDGEPVVCGRVGVLGGVGVVDSATLVAYTSRSASTYSARAVATASVVWPASVPPITGTSPRRIAARASS
jgi:hypothetical protein